MNNNRLNTDPELVINAGFLSYYKGVPVIRLPMGFNAFSLGVIVLGRKVKSHNILKHEYGHYLQFKKMGFFKYMRKVFVPSLTANILDRLKKLPYDYYGSPWEAEADSMGGVVRSIRNAPWPVETPIKYSTLLKMFKNRKCNHDR